MGNPNQAVQIKQLPLEIFPDEPILGVWKQRNEIAHMGPREWGKFYDYVQRTKKPILPYSVAHRLGKMPRILFVGEPRSGKTRAALWLISELFWDVLKEQPLHQFYTVDYDAVIRMFALSPPFIIHDESEKDFQGAQTMQTRRYRLYRTLLESQAYKNTVFVAIHHDPPPGLAKLFNYVVIVSEKGGRPGWLEVYRIQKNVKKIVMQSRLAPDLYATKIEMFRAPLPPKKVEKEFREIEPIVKDKIQKDLLDMVEDLEGNKVQTPDFLKIKQILEANLKKMSKLDI